MDLGTQLILAGLIFVLLLLIILLLSHLQILEIFPETTGRFKWALLEENSEERRGILQNDSRFGSGGNKMANLGIGIFSRQISQSTEKFGSKLEVDRLEDFSGLLESGEHFEGKRSERQYLVPAEEIHCSLEVLANENTMADVHKALPGKEAVPVSPNLKRAISTESLDSTASSLFEVNNDVPTLHFTLTYHEPTQMLSCQVHSLDDCSSIEGQVWMLFFLLPHSKPLWRTEAEKVPSTFIEYRCLFQQCVRKTDLHRIALLVQLYSSNGLSANVIGSCRLRLKDANLITKGEAVMNLALTSNNIKNPFDEFTPASLGEILFLVNFHADRLSVVISKLRNLDKLYMDVFIRVYIVQPMGKVIKKKTSIKSILDGGANVMESLFVNISRQKLLKSHIRLSVVCSERSGGVGRSIGHVTLGGKTGGRELGQWMRIIDGEQTHTATWHHILPRNTSM
ncbi:unnamed protein product, partial [Mesorhabditis belari]|uniref:Uncharacterized protein n=1 Tax=Mesorhabditis belari TaxID=2138241 RepID=A0AAF3EF95_9BILA